MEETFKCPICDHINFAKHPTWGIPIACENCGNTFIIEEEENDDNDDE